jgi:hypothetical protein
VRKVTDRPHGVVVSDHQLLGRLPSSAVRSCDQMAAGPLPGDEPGREAARLESAASSDRTPEWLAGSDDGDSARTSSPRKATKGSRCAQVAKYRGAVCQHRTAQ